MRHVLDSFEMNKKGWKMAEKNVSASFQVLQAPESWSKYTTNFNAFYDFITVIS